jgi:transposase InsO family protein
LLKLGFVVSNRSIRRYRLRPRRPPGQTWRTFLRNHRPSIWAVDLFTVHTLAFRTLYVLLFITHDRRELVHLAVTAHPTAAWIWRQLIEATPSGRQPRYLVRDRDRVYGGDFAARARGLGIETLLTPVRAPRANAIAERVVRTLRNECLDHLVVINEAHLRAVLGEYAAYYNAERPHRLHLGSPLPPRRDASIGAGPIRARAALSGLHHVYERAA